MLNMSDQSNAINEYINLYNDKQYDQIIDKCYGEKIEATDNPQILNIVGASYQQLNKLTLAKEYFTKSSELDPGFAETFYNLGNIYFAEESFQQAFDNYNKAFNANFSSPIILVQMGRCLVKMDAVEDAKVLYENALEIDSNCEQAHIELAEIMRLKGDPQSAIDYFYSALEINPHSSLCLLRLARYFNELNRPRMALNFVQKAINLGIADKEIYFEQAQILQKIGLHGESIFTLRNLLEKDNQNSKVFDLIGTNLFTLGIIDEAIERFCDAIYLKPETAHYYQNLGMTLSAAGRFKDAEECLIKATQLAEGSAEPHYELGKMYDKSGDFKNALEQYEISTNLARDSIFPIMGKFSLSGFSPNLKPGTLFKEICSHLTEHQPSIDLSNKTKKTCDTPRALVSLTDSKGSLYVQSLMDGHPELSTLPGYYLKTWFEEKTWPIFDPDLTNTNWRQILANDICRHFEPLFDASSKKAVLGISTHENPSAAKMGLDKLGKKQSKPFYIDVDLFKEKFMEILLPFDQINQKNCFELIHQAFDFAYRSQSSKNISDKKIFYNFGQPDLYAFLKFLSHYPDSKILSVIQDPIQHLEDLIYNGFEKLSGKDIQKDLNTVSTVNDKIIQTILFINHPLNTVCNVGGVKLEDLIGAPNETMPKIAKWLDITEVPELHGSTFLDHPFLQATSKTSISDQLLHKADKNVLDDLLDSKDRKILETLFWPLLNAFKYTKKDKNQFNKDLEQIRPWLDKPLHFEKEFYAKIGEKTLSLESLDSYQALHRHLIHAWELLNENHTYPNLIGSITD